MAKTVTVSLNDLKKLVDYSYEDEERNLEDWTRQTAVAMDGPCKGHIFHVLKRLNRAVEQAEKSGKPLVVAKVISPGELDIKPGTKQADIIQQAGYALDRCESGEIMGDLCFQATNGKYYSVFVEALIEEVDKSRADEIAEMNGENADEGEEE
jgi:hypothetical protein